MLHHVPDNVTPELAGIVTPLANGIEWALFDAEVGYASTVLIQGPGQQGLSQVVACKQAGADLVIITGTSKDAKRLEIAKVLGADHVIDVQKEDPLARINAITGGKGVDVVLDCTAGAGTLPVMLGVEALKRKAGTLLIQGEMTDFPNFPIGRVTVKYITIKSARGHSYQGLRARAAAARFASLPAGARDDPYVRSRARGLRDQVGRRRGREGRHPRLAAALAVVKHRARRPRTRPGDHPDRVSRRRENNAAEPHPSRAPWPALCGDRQRVRRSRYRRGARRRTDEELFEMNNGCVCCTVRGDLIRTLHLLLGSGRELRRDLVETTGLADPGPVAQTFFVDLLLQARTVLDSVTTLVDAKHILMRLPTAARRGSRSRSPIRSC